MPLPTKYSAALETLQAGQVPAGFTDRTAALQALMDELCATPWLTDAARKAAQELVARLGLMLLRESARPASTPGELAPQQDGVCGPLQARAARLAYLADRNRAS